jgi:hypothetical protein
MTSIGNTGYYPGMEWTVGVPAANRGCEMSEHWELCTVTDGDGNPADDHGFVVAGDCEVKIDGPNATAKARLIAAAPGMRASLRPDLLRAAAEQIERANAPGAKVLRDVAAEQEAAIAKAEAQP